MKLNYKKIILQTIIHVVLASILIIIFGFPSIFFGSLEYQMIWLLILLVILNIFKNRRR